jgi:DedD protein
MAEAAQDVETLKRRGRRRLVGAMALVLAAVIVLPMVFDPEPKRPEVAVNVRIPGESETTFAPKVTAQGP